MRFGHRSVSQQMRLLVGVMMVVIPLIASSSILTVRGMNTDVEYTTLVVTPVLDRTSAVRQAMTDANAAWRPTVTPGGVRTPTYLEGRATVDGLIKDQARLLEHDVVSAKNRRRYAVLLEHQQSSVDGWWAAANAATQAPAAGRFVLALRADLRFNDFRTASKQLEESLVGERETVRQGIRSSLRTLVITTGLLAIFVVLLLLLLARTINRSVTAPLQALRAVVHRQRDGDRLAEADTTVGAQEVRDLATDFNGLTRTNEVLEDEHAEVLLMHQLAIDVALGVQGGHDLDAALHYVCASLGQVMAVDRVLLYTLNEGGAVEERTQWHRSDLPNLAPLPRSLSQIVRSVSDELREHGSVFALRDILDSEVQSDPRAESFHRATGARALLMVPVGLGASGLGVLSIMMVDRSRKWRRHEVQAVQQCAGYLAQAIVQLRFSQMQEEQVRRLTELDRQKTDFMATVSHELRTPLTSISGYLELLEDGDYGDLTEAQRSALDVIGRNSTRLRGLIEDLLVLNKIEASGLRSSLERVGVADLVGGVVEMLKPVAARGGVVVEVAPIDPVLVAQVDRGQFERALINLGSNAVKFTPEGGAVTLRAHREDEGIAIEVVDSGIGIPAAELGRLTERFFRASNASAAAIPGTGLGLAIVRTIVEGHGGHVAIDSTEGKGTVVRLWLPVEQE